jgi:recombinational DNA repair ATPase RecF
MRLLTLDIKNIRGIKTIHVEPNAENLVVYGPNGTGKSAIVDAIDFLLSGQITRLSGEGSKSLDIKEHGCHVDSREDLKNTVVRAKVIIDNVEATIERSIAKPNTLKVEPKTAEDIVLESLEVTDLGQHILTRREILQYITSEAGKRAKKVLALLNLDIIENSRQTLVSTRNDAETEVLTNDRNVEIAKSNIKTLLAIDEFTEEKILKQVNIFRKLLDGPELELIVPEMVKKDVKARPFDALQCLTNIDEVTAIIKEVRTIASDAESLIGVESRLVTLLKEVQNDQLLKKLVLYRTLIQAGIPLVDEKNTCPLCGRKWEGDFSKFLVDKQQEIENGREKQEAISKNSYTINRRISVFKNYIEKCSNARKELDSDFNTDKTSEYVSELSSWQQAIENPIQSYESGKFPSNIEKLFLNTFIEKELLKPLEILVKKVDPNLTDKQKAWDTLTKLEERWQVYTQALKEKQKSELIKKRAYLSLEKFETARNTVLESIYDAVKEDFVGYYKKVHGEDEAAFTSNIEHKGAELKFEVEFYQRGKFPPHALHSEGHQDSMGLALFFALNSYLVKDKMGIIVLDDVVMSIDCGHRRGVCELLRTFKEKRQFIITTHDNAWAKQLRSQGIVTKKNLIHFTNWNISTGPIFEFEKDLWTLLTEDLEKDQVPIAAARLRRNAENFFDDVCDSLCATIRYKGMHQWELGDYAPAALSAYKKYLKKAKNNACILKDKDKLQALTKLEEDSAKIFTSSQIEQWAINANVHYNKWDNFSREDFAPVIAAYHNLFDLFECNKCGSLILFEEPPGKNRATVSCSCGNIFWNVNENVQTL